MGHTMEQQWSNNGAYHGATMGHTMEQQWGILWSNNGAYHGARIGHIQPHYVSIYSPVIILLHSRL